MALPSDGTPSPFTRRFMSDPNWESTKQGAWLALGAWGVHSLSRLAQAGEGLAAIGRGMNRLADSAKAYEPAVTKAGEGLSGLAASAKAYEPAVDGQGQGGVGAAGQPGGQQAGQTWRRS